MRWGFIRVSARDSGKTQLEAVLGEIIVTVEKLSWLIKEGEAVLKPSKRGAGVMVSEHTSWSVAYYRRIIDAALAAAGAPPGLVSLVTGYGDAGHALVTGGVNKVIFVGSTEVGKKVMQAAAERLTPVTLELGGKDAFVVCDDADLSQVVPIAIKAAFLNCGQNCASGERFIVQRKIYGQFLSQVVDVVGRMRQGPTLGAGVTRDMQIYYEEVFGPVMTVIPFDTDEEAVAIANDCHFGLGSSVFSRSIRRGRKIASQLEAGMTSINDFNATYMCQYSGFGRFGGPEGLRALCIPKAVAEDALPWLMKTTIPPLWQHPVGPAAGPFAVALTTMFYGPSLGTRASGLTGVLKAVTGWGQGSSNSSRDSSGAAAKAKGT
eukprot:gene3897-4151_t